eukprot:s568_g30.t2
MLQQEMTLVTLMIFWGRVKRSQTFPLMISNSGAHPIGLQKIMGDLITQLNSASVREFYRDASVAIANGGENLQTWLWLKPQQHSRALSDRLVSLVSSMSDEHSQGEESEESWDNSEECSKTEWLKTVVDCFKKEKLLPFANQLEVINEAVFAFKSGDEECVDETLAAELFEVIQMIRNAWKKGEYDNSSTNFFYDYVSLLGTVQNQCFFGEEETTQFHLWLKEAVDSIILGARPASLGSASCPPVWDVAVRVPGLCEVIIAQV